MKRYLYTHINQDLANKIVLVMGPRQSGKTTLAKGLQKEFDYYNYDALDDRKTLLDQGWDRNKKLIIFDELHKMNEWKRWLKGIYDTEGIPPELLVTGSAKLNTFKKVGDSLAGRFFQYRLHPLDLKELVQFLPYEEETLFQQLWDCSGFPEPFLAGKVTYYKRWASIHLDIILRQDLIDLYTVHDLKAIETLIVLLRNRVGSGVSYSNLARDLEKDVSTIKRWLVMLEELYIIYRVTPYFKTISRSLLKEPKFYFYDHNQVSNGDGAKLENLVANALLKRLHFKRDTAGDRVALHYLRTKDKREIDFAVSIDDQVTYLIEVKTSDSVPSKHFKVFSKMLPDAKQLQLVRHLKRDSTYPDGVEVRRLVPWLATFDL